MLFLMGSKEEWRDIILNKVKSLWCTLRTNSLYMSVLLLHCTNFLDYVSALFLTPSDVWESLMLDWKLRAGVLPSAWPALGANPDSSAVWENTDSCI